jgi:RNA polymerase sigma factor (sigma-70 family)
VARIGGGFNRETARLVVDASNSMRQDVGAFDFEGVPEVAGLTSDEAVAMTDGMISKSTLFGYMAASNPVSYDALMHDAYDDSDPYGDGLGSPVERDDFLDSDPDFLGQRHTADSLEPMREPARGSESLSVRLSNAVRRLPPQRQRVALLTAEGFGPTEIAMEMGLSEETVKVHKREAMKQLREELEDSSSE